MGISLGGIIGGAAGFFLGGPAGAMIGYGLGSGSDAAKEQNRLAMDAAAGQMAFQERMSSSAYRRAVADMKGAGLNPMLAYSQGGASSPSGAQAQGLESPTGKGFATAVQAAQVATGVSNVKADTALKNAQVVKEAAVAEQSVATADQARAQTNQLKLESVDRALQIKEDAKRAGHERAIRGVDDYLRAQDGLFGQDIKRAEREKLFAERDTSQHRARSTAADVKRAEAEAEIRRSQVYRAQRDESYERNPWGGKYERYIPDIPGVVNSAGSAGLKFRELGQ